jgi:hypothetical protein
MIDNCTVNPLEEVTSCGDWTVCDPINWSNQVNETCPACCGTRVQRRCTDGLKVICPACNGEGTIAKYPWVTTTTFTC